MADAESSEVLNAIMSTPAPPPRADQADGEAAPKPTNAPSRAADGRFATADEDLDPAEEAILEDEAPDDQAPEEAPEEEQPEEERPEEEAPQSLDEYTVEVVVDGKKEEVQLGELKRAYSGAKYVERNIQQAVEFRKSQETAAAQAYQIIEQQNHHLEAIAEVWNKFASPQVDLEALRHRDPQAYALKRVELMEAQEKAQKIQQEIDARRQQQAQIVAEARARRVEDETRVLLQKLPALADPQKAPVVMGKIREVAQSYGVSDDELNGLDGHVPLMVLAELAWRRDQMASTEARLKRPTGDQPRPKTLIRPGTAKPAQSSAKKLEAQLLTRARKSGKPDDVAATLLVARKR